MIVLRSAVDKRLILNEKLENLGGSYRDRCWSDELKVRVGGPAVALGVMAGLVPAIHVISTSK
jgi:hypothetical protein